MIILRLKKSIKEHFPEVLFIMESKHKCNILVDLQEWLGYEKFFTVNPISYSGGLAVLWKSNIEVVVKYADKNHDLDVQFGDLRFFFVMRVW